MNVPTKRIFSKMTLQIRVNMSYSKKISRNPQNVDPVSNENAKETLNMDRMQKAPNEKKRKITKISHDYTPIEMKAMMRCKG